MPPLFPVTVLIPGGQIAVHERTGVRRVDLLAFRIGATPVTNAQYAPFLESSGGDPTPWWNDPRFSHPLQPVVGITWGEAAAYCDWLTLAGPARWRLPSEDEWERAMGGGAESPRSAWGDIIPPWEIPEGPLKAPWRVGRGTPNPYGVLDPGTVVHEWCLDWREPEIPAPAGGPTPPLRRASRGGSWRHRIRWSAPSARSSLPPDYRYSDYGFRVLSEDRA